jgi:hypothetical protein
MALVLELLFVLMA